MNQGDRTTVESHADTILKKHGIISPYVNAFEIAREEGIDVVTTQFPDEHKNISGFFTDDDKTIYINQDVSSVRQLFTVAHELGHYFLGHAPDTYGILKRIDSYDNGTKAPIEKEADYFAACLLMPKAMIQRTMKEFGFAKDAPEVIAKLYGVSPSAMRYRLINLGYISQ